MKKSLTLLIMLAITVITINAQTQQQADSLYQIGRELVNNGKATESRPYSQQAMEMYKMLHGEVSEDYINALNAYAASFGQEEDYQKAIELEQQVIDLCDQLDHPHPRLDLFTQNMGYYCYFANDYENGTKYWERALPLTEKFSDKYGTIVQGLAMMYEKLGDIEGVTRMMALMQEHNTHELSLPCEELKCMLERATYYTSIGDNANAKEWYLKAVNTAQGEDRIEVYEAFSQFLCMTMKDYTTGAEYQLSAAKLRKNLSGENEDYFNSLYTAGIYSYFGKNYRQAIECYLPIIAYYQQFDSPSAKSNVAKCQKNLGIAYSAMKDYSKAKECYQQTLAYYETYDKENEEYPKALVQLATAEKLNKEYDESIEHYKQALKIFEERGMEEDYVNTAIELNSCYVHAGRADEVVDYDNALKAAQKKELDAIIHETKESLQLVHDYLGELSYASSLATIAGCYALEDDYSNAIEYYELYMPAIRNAIRTEFQLQSENERMLTWKEESNNIQGLKELLISIPEDEKTRTSEMATLTYDAALLSKGILLNSAIEFEKLIAQIGDPHLKSIYEQTKANEAEIAHLRESAETDEELDRILRLTEENKSLQLQLYRGCKELADFTDYISYDWKAVQQVLKSTDVAIEFVSINPLIDNADEIMVALVLTKEMQAPIAITLWNNEDLMKCDETEAYEQLQNDIISHILNQSCDLNYLKDLLSSQNSSTSPYHTEISLYLQCMITEKEADTSYLPTSMIGLMTYKQLMNNNSLYDTQHGGTLVWGALKQYLQGKERVFFSADGCFNHIGIEYLKYEGKPFSEQFEVYRLSSTKELCYKHQAQPLEKIALFGNIDYTSEATQSAKTTNELLALRTSNGGFANLSATKREVNSIEAILKQNGNRTVTKLTDTEASQSAFLSLSGSKVNLIHIATHGMYADTEGATESESMDNSILAFSGANLYEDTHDGLVSASTIATMDLRQCDLAVLSACETGLGMLGDDGVFGLQRGFKNAGVHTLLMSIKKVYDASTADLMTHFYQNLTEGLSKRDALVKAQKTLRENGYPDAKYWATFILLDAIE